MIEKVSFEITRGNFQKMLKWTSAPLSENYDKAWLNFQKDSIHQVANMGQSVVSYCTYRPPFVENIELFDGADVDAGVETLINIENAKNYVEFVGGEKVKVSFFGNEDEKLCRKMAIDGDIHLELFVPHSEADYESQQTGIVNLYDDDNRWLKPSDEEPLSTRFRVKMEEFQRIKKATDFDDFVLSTYPVVVEDGEFVLNASDENERNSLTGSLSAEDVEGPDVNNSYNRGFSELVDNISGEVWVDIGDGKPMSIVRESSDGAMTLRYVLLPAQ